MVSQVSSNNLYHNYVNLLLLMMVGPSVLAFLSKNELQKKNDEIFGIKDLLHVETLSWNFCARNLFVTQGLVAGVEDSSTFCETFLQRKFHKLGLLHSAIVSHLHAVTHFWAVIQCSFCDLVFLYCLTVLSLLIMRVFSQLCFAVFSLCITEHVSQVFCIANSHAGSDG